LDCEDDESREKLRGRSFDAHAAEKTDNEGKYRKIVGSAFFNAQINLIAFRFSEAIS